MKKRPKVPAPPFLPAPPTVPSPASISRALAQQSAAVERTHRVTLAGIEAIGRLHREGSAFFTDVATYVSGVRSLGAGNAEWEARVDDGIAELLPRYGEELQQRLASSAGDIIDVVASSHEAHSWADGDPRIPPRE